MHTDEEQDNEESNPGKIEPVRIQEDREHNTNSGQMVRELEQDPMNNEGLGVAPNQRSMRTHAGSTTMSHNKNCNPMTKDVTHK